MKKQNFLDLLKTLTPEEINKFIENNGIGPKPICPVVFNDGNNL